jgi:hypothetical protein
MPGFAGQHVSKSRLVYGRRGDDLFEEADIKRVSRGRMRAASRHQKAEMLKAKPEGRSVLTSGGASRSVLTS